MLFILQHIKRSKNHCSNPSKTNECVFLTSHCIIYSILFLQSQYGLYGQKNTCGAVQ